MSIRQFWKDRDKGIDWLLWIAAACFVGLVIYLVFK